MTYQIYPRSFADADNDGVGDIAGMTSRLDHVADLGVDAVWVSPWYASPMADGGYDVADHRAIDPGFGTLADADAFLAAAHARGLRVLIDLVPNHTSEQHPWFVAALASEPGSAARDRYLFRDGRGPDGVLPPTNWPSVFGGSAWTRTAGADGTPGQWYLHLFTPQQPDLNWRNPEVVEAFDDILRFWFERGIDGFRVDVADALVKDADFPDLPDPADPPAAQHPYWGRPELADIQRRWRALADSFPGDRVFVSEANAPNRLDFLAPDRLHTTFTFDGLFCAFEADSIRNMVTHNLAVHDAIGAPTAWVLGNHDSARPVTRHGKRFTGWRFPASGVTPEDERFWSEHLFPWPTNVPLGRRRARALALLHLALPGGAYVYQGEELGLEEVEDLPLDALRDPLFRRTNGRVRGRDGCRVPLPWSGDRPPFGFSADADPWLPQPAHWASLTAQAQAADPDSTLSLYRAALRLRRAHPALGSGTLRWDAAASDTVVAFRRDPGFLCVVNTGREPVGLPDGDLLLASAPVADRLLPPDAAAWLATPGTPGEP